MDMALSLFVSQVVSSYKIIQVICISVPGAFFLELVTVIDHLLVEQVF